MAHFADLEDDKSGAGATRE